MLVKALTLAGWAAALLCSPIAAASPTRAATSSTTALPAATGEPCWCPVGIGADPNGACRCNNIRLSSREILHQAVAIPRQFSYGRGRTSGCQEDRDAWKYINLAAAWAPEAEGRLWPRRLRGCCPRRGTTVTTTTTTTLSLTTTRALLWTLSQTDLLLSLTTTTRTGPSTATTTTLWATVASQQVTSTTVTTRITQPSLTLTSTTTTLTSKRIIPTFIDTRMPDCFGDGCEDQ